MTNKEVLDCLKWELEWGGFRSEYYQNILEKSIKALEKQIPLKPIVDYKYPENLRKIMVIRNDAEEAERKVKRCPVCENPLNIISFIKKLTNRDIGDTYCKWCGQAILWEED